MKNSFGYRDDHRPSFVLAFVGALAIALALGCATGSTPARKAYTTLSDVDAAAKATMGVFNTQYQAGQRTEAQRTQVLAAYAKYQKAALLALTVAQDVTQSASALKIANDAVAPLLDLIASFVPAKGTP
jgi:hypothetical protein